MATVHSESELMMKCPAWMVLVVFVFSIGSISYLVMKSAQAALPCDSEFVDTVTTMIDAN